VTTELTPRQMVPVHVHGLSNATHQKVGQPHKGTRRVILSRRDDTSVANGRFKLGMFFVSSITLQAKHELTSKAASKSGFLRLLQVGPAIIAKDR